MGGGGRGERGAGRPMNHKLYLFPHPLESIALLDSYNPKVAGGTKFFKRDEKRRRLVYDKLVMSLLPFAP
jgi:hypothetical protein